LIVQLAVVLLCIWIGVEFHYFVQFLESGGEALFVERPPGVEGFLPISSLMSIYYFVLSGGIHPAHPAGMFILLSILIMSIVFGKSFCSWICPAGFLSEYLGEFGRKIFRRKLRLPRLFDYPLRSLKYLILVFFTYSIFVLMDEQSLKQFLDSPYNLVADVKMYYFFAELSRFGLIVLSILIVGSIVLRNFWCRYLCPYGALLGILSILSPHKIKRNAANCIDCGKCAVACPSNIKVDKVLTVVSDECTACQNCIDVCPVANTLDMKSIVVGRRVPKMAVGITTVAIFLAVIGAAMLAGQWQNDVTPEEYLHHQEYVKSYGHPTGPAEIEELKDDGNVTIQKNK
jgi:polyferredoxin